MSGRAARVFAPSQRDVPYRRAIIVGITGPSFAGKTYSGMRLGAGFVRVIGGRMGVIDTEADRARHYEDYFDFDHFSFPPPHGPLDYLDAINTCVARGISVVLIDNMTHEHDGEGGVLDQIDRFMEQKEAEYAAKGWNFNRETFNFSAQIKPKRERKQLNKRIVQLGTQVVFILCYQAEEKIRPRKKGELGEDGKVAREPETLGWQPVTTSKLPYDMTVRFLLTPASDGVPLLLPPNPAERRLIKQPKQFIGWFKDGEQISEEMGERLARWAVGKSSQQTGTPPSGAAAPAPTAADYVACTDLPTFEALEKRRAEIWKRMPPSPEKSQLKDASDSARARLADGGSGAPDHDSIAIAALRACANDAERAAKWREVYDDYEARTGKEPPLPVEAVNHEMKEKFDQAT